MKDIPKNLSLTLFYMTYMISTFLLCDDGLAIRHCHLLEGATSCECWCVI